MSDPSHKFPIQGSRASTAEEIRLRWLSIIESLIEEAKHGNVKGFKLLREEAWCVPVSIPVEPVIQIPLEELLGDEGGLESQDLLKDGGEKKP